MPPLRTKNKSVGKKTDWLLKLLNQECSKQVIKKIK